MKQSFVSMAGPLAIVAIGILLLLSTLGVVPWNVWDELARWWPALVILLGLGILVQNLRGRSKG